MRILLSEKQFNLIILSETFKIKGSEWDYSPDEVIKAIKDAGYKGKSEVREGKRSLWVLANKFELWDKIFPKKSIEQLIDEVRKEIQQGKDNDIYKERSDVIRNGKLYRSLEKIIEETDLDILDEFFPKDIPIGKIFKKGYSKYTPDETIREIQQGIDNGVYEKRNDVRIKNFALYNNAILRINRKIGVDILDEFFPKHTPIGKIFKKPYKLYTPDETIKEVKQGINEGFYETRGELSELNLNLYKRILELDKKYKLGLMLELFPDKNESRGELLIKKYLKSEKINYLDQHKFDGLKSSKGKQLKVDFYLPKYAAVIEFDGSQHFTIVRRSKNQTEEELELDLQIIQERDKLKNEYCNGKYKLYRIKHNSRSSISPEDLNKKMGVILKDIMSGQFKLDFNKTGQYI
jgi:hypothetical protein